MAIANDKESEAYLKVFKGVNAIYKYKKEYSDVINNDISDENHESGSVQPKDDDLIFNLTDNLHRLPRRFENTLKGHLLSTKRRFRNSVISLMNTETDNRKRNISRLIERDRDFAQTYGNLRISKKANKRTWLQIFYFYYRDWFHILICMPLHYFVLVVTFSYTLAIMFFGTLFSLISSETNNNCNLNSETNEVIPYLATLGFSLHTGATVGYGTVDDTRGFFSNCPRIPVVVLLQWLFTIFLNGVLVGVFFQRIGRADARSSRVIFSEKTCLICSDGRYFIAFQVYDLEKRIPLVEAHARCYAVSQRASVATENAKNDVRCVPMRLQNPNDDIGGVLFMLLPCVIIHEIEPGSPLYPPNLIQNDDNGKTDLDSFIGSYDPDLELRERDFVDGDCDIVSCPTCGEAFNTRENLRNHIEYNLKSERALLATPAEVSKENERQLHIDMLQDDLLNNISAAQMPHEMFKEELKRHFKNSNLELIVLIEGIEPTMSLTFQARASYNLSDVAFDYWFAPCTGSSQAEAAVFLDDFNKLISVGDNFY